jgi:DNA polymerase III subunit gamma/tau
MFGDEVAPQPHRALYLRWRPLRFEDVVGQEHVTRTLRNASAAGKLAHAYLFTGPRGTGKTSVARILYRAANCENLADGDPDNTCPICLSALDGRALDLVEIDAASNRGIDDVRDLRDKVAFRPSIGKYRLYILDEAHEFTTPAWDAFLKTLEEPPPHAIFVLATTEAHKVPATIVSRCQRFDFRRIPFEAARDQLAKVARDEGLSVDAAVLERIARASRGGLRDALSLLDQLTAFTGAHVDMDVARAVLGLPAVETVHAVVEGLGRRDAAAVMAHVADVAEGGADLRQFVEELVTALRGVLLVRAGADARVAMEFGAEDVAWLQAQAPAWTVGALSELLQQLTNALARVRDAQQFQVQTELALLAAATVPDHAGLAPTARTPSPAVAHDEPPGPAPATATAVSEAGADRSRAGLAPAARAPSPVAAPGEPAPGPPAPVAPAPELAAAAPADQPSVVRAPTAGVSSPPVANGESAAETAAPGAAVSDAGADRPLAGLGPAEHAPSPTVAPGEAAAEAPIPGAAAGAPADDTGAAGPVSPAPWAPAEVADADGGVPRQGRPEDAPASATPAGTTGPIDDAAPSVAGAPGSDTPEAAGAAEAEGAPGGLPPEAASSPRSLEGAGGRGGEGAALDEVRARWGRVVEFASARRRMLAAPLSSSEPIAVRDSSVVVAFASDSNRRFAERPAIRQAIEEALRHELGRELRLVCTVRRDDRADSWLDDPVINYAVRTFGGRPQRVSSGQIGDADPP